MGSSPNRSAVHKAKRRLSQIPITLPPPPPIAVAVSSEAALLDPHAIVFFATDGIVSTRPLIGLAARQEGATPSNFGDWEYCEADGGLFVMPGVYTYGKVALR